MRRSGRMRLVLVLWIALGLVDAQVLSYAVHSKGFALGYTSDYTFQGNLLEASKAHAWRFRPQTESGSVVVQISTARYLSEAQKICRSGGFVCQLKAKEEVKPDQFRLEFDQSKAGNTQIWQAYVAKISGVWLLVYLEDSNRIGLLEHFWRNSRFEQR